MITIETLVRHINVIDVEEQNHTSIIYVQQRNLTGRNMDIHQQCVEISIKQEHGKKKMVIPCLIVKILIML